MEAQNQLRQRGETVAEPLSRNIVTPYLALDMLAIYELIVAAARSPGVQHIYFFDPEGKILHDGTRDIAMYGENIRMQFPQIQPEQLEEQNLVIDSSMAIVLPVMAEDDHLGSVAVILSTEPFLESLNLTQTRLDEIANSAMRNSLIQLLSASFGMILLAALFALLAGRRLHGRATQLPRGDFRHGPGYAVGDGLFAGWTAAGDATPRHPPPRVG